MSDWQLEFHGWEPTPRWALWRLLFLETWRRRIVEYEWGGNPVASDGGSMPPQWRCSASSWKKTKPGTKPRGRALVVARAKSPSDGWGLPWKNTTSDFMPRSHSGRQKSGV